MVKSSVMSEETLARQNGGHLTKRPGLKAVEPIEEALRRRSPFPISYDVNRSQPWYFSEFAYTEFMGGIYVYPQNDELACKIMQAAVPGDLAVEALFREREQREGTLDKYQLPATDLRPKKIVILPGTNLLTTLVSREALTRCMWEDEEIVIKPHPITHENEIKRLKFEFGAGRVLPAQVSGAAMIRSADVIYTVGSTELAMYGVLHGARVVNIGNVFFERTAAYYPMMRRVQDQPQAVARARLLEMLTAPDTGVLFPEDPAWPEKMDAFFENAMALRQQFKPLVFNSHTYPTPPAKPKEEPSAVRKG